jgi:DNA-binding CsgD family transcriptional regulator
MPFDKSDISLPGFMLAPCFAFMAHWGECLHGDGSLRETLSAFSDLTLAPVVHLHRVNAETGAQRAIATLDRSAADGARPLVKAHGTALAGKTLARAKPGTLWSMQELDRDAASGLDPRVLGWMEARGFRDAMMIPLSSAGEKTDVLEFYLTVPLDRPRRGGIETLAVAMATAWGRRPEGRIARVLRVAPAIQARLSQTKSAADPLSQSNPLGLTAAELRICGMIRQGFQLAEAGRHLGIAESTLRTHLRSIFAKAGVAGQVGLVRLLLEAETGRTSLRA